MPVEIGETSSGSWDAKTKKEVSDKHTYVTLHGKTDTNAFPFKLQNRLLSVYIRLNGSWKRLNGLLIRLKKFASV